MLTEASYFELLTDSVVHCHLCPQSCVLSPDERGKCGVRKNMDGSLMSENYGLVSALHMDPIEKKPLYHFYPGSHILSIGSIGCNFQCNFCQNCDISQTTVDDYLSGKFHTPKEIIKMAQEYQENLGIAFTYNEPTVYYEFMLETAKECLKANMVNVMVSNGYISSTPLEQLLPYFEGFNIDLKSFSSKFYKDVAGGRLNPVLETLEQIRDAGKHLEITFLVIPSLNDDMRDFSKMITWIRDKLGKETVLHLSRYFPAYKSTIPKTSLKLMFDMCEKARQYLDYVYLGNVTGSESQNTICNNCGKMVISRFGNFIQKNGIDNKGNCIHCNNHIVVN